MIYFWATWCPACKFVTPTVDWMSSDFEVISVAITSGENRRLNAFMENQDYSFKVINDSNGTLGREWGYYGDPPEYRDHQRWQNRLRHDGYHYSTRVVVKNAF